MAVGFDSSIRAGLLEKRKHQVQEIATKLMSSMLIAGSNKGAKELAAVAVQQAEALVKEIERKYGEEEVLGISASKPASR